MLYSNAKNRISSKLQKGQRERADSRVLIVILAIVELSTLTT